MRLIIRFSAVLGLLAATSAYADPPRGYYPSDAVDINNFERLCPSQTLPGQPAEPAGDCLGGQSGGPDQYGG